MIRIPSIEVHLKNSKERTGRDYKDLHEWIDSDKAKVIEKYDIVKIPENIEYVMAKWGKERVKEFVFHIKEDLEHRLKENLQYFGLLI